MEALDWSKPLQHSDPYDLVRIAVEGDTLHATVRFSGGCESHVFELVENGPLVRSMPPKHPLALVHDARGDACREAVVESVHFELKSFRAGPRGLTVLSIGDTLLPYRYD